MTTKEKLEKLQELLAREPRDTSKEGADTTSATINQLIYDLLQEEIVEMRKIGIIVWVQKNPELALILVVLVSFGSGVSLADIIGPLLNIFA